MAGPETRQTLLIKIRDENDLHSWNDFVAVYEPLILGFCIWRQQSKEDAKDITQEVLSTVSKAIKVFDYDATKGSFRSWLLTVTRRKLIDHVRRENRQPSLAGESELAQLQEVPPPDSDELEVWEKDYRKRMFDWASLTVKDEFEKKTWDAFWATAVEGRRGTEVASELDLNVGSVYAAKSRILRRLREKIGQVAGEWDLYAEDAN